MGLKAEKGRSSVAKAAVIQCNNSDAIDHWAFLEEIEAPMWADLTMEAPFMDQEDIDSAWFLVSHSFHQMSSQKLKKYLHGKDKERLHNLRCHSPEVPDSVSRSRGKHYKSRKWLESTRESTAKQHPVRKLGATSLQTEIKKDLAHETSRSTITICSLSRTPSECLLTDNEISITETNIISGKAPSSTAMSKYQNLRSKVSVGFTRSTPKRGTLRIACKTSSAIQPNLTGNRKTLCSRKERNKTEDLLHKLNSSSGKSSVGSSNSLGSVLENAHSTNSAKNGRDNESKKSLASLPKVHEKKSKHRVQHLQHQTIASSAKIVCKESKSKVLGSNKIRKPASGFNKPKSQTNVAVTKQTVVAGAERSKMQWMDMVLQLYIDPSEL
ncbi:hypothetical protein ZIOFF_053872 [Zingiber officinale]|uniref:Uncharacterized protein n=1 Tax=Zingiber officinale TaxID=94328 RepID=A0A8J5FF48_ZINOF|nr:hypothetical protein ZIOFF_053872 [Zingiber officinale]